MYSLPARSSHAPSIRRVHFGCQRKVRKPWTARSVSPGYELPCLPLSSLCQTSPKSASSVPATKMCEPFARVTGIAYVILPLLIPSDEFRHRMEDVEVCQLSPN